MSNIWLPFTQMKLSKGLPVVTKAKGSHLTLETGDKIIDAISSWWVITHGHCDPDIVKAVQKQAETLDQVLFANFMHKPALDLTKEILSLMPKKISKVFFSDDGSTSVEVALKQALQSQIQKGQTSRNLFISFQNSYHGDTAGAMSVSGPSIFTKPYKDMLFKTLIAKQGQLSTDTPESFYQDFENLLNQHSKNICAVIIEPFIQGAGGMIMWPKEAINHILKLAKQAGIYIIFDEVMTGFGRTGSLFAFEQLDTQPDIICLSKGLTGGFLPLGLTLSTEEVYSSFLSSKKEKSLFHGHSFTGNPLSAAAALANIKKIKKEKQQLKIKWQNISNIHKERVSNIRSNQPHIRDVRTQGIIGAIETQKGDWSKGNSEKLAKKALSKGVFLRPLGPVIYTLPPYSITEGELHQVWDVMEELANLRTF